MTQKENLRIAQEAVDKDYGHLNAKVQSVVFKCNGDECLVTTNCDSIRYLHGEFDSFCGGEKEWSFDEHDKEDFSSKREFFNGYGY